MKDAVLPGFVLHQEIEPARSAAQHVADIARGEDHAFGFTRSA